MVNQNSGNELGLTNKTIIVTGAAQGIGRAVATRLAHLGAQVVLADLQDCADAAAEAGHGARACALDMTDPASIDAMLADAARNAPLWGVVNCAGLLLRRPLDVSTQAEIDRQTAVNQSGAFHLARGAMAAMQAQGNGGRIVLYTSQGAFTGGFHGSIPYAMNKAAVTALVKSLARIGARNGITVNAVAPGAIDTKMFRGGLSDAEVAEFERMIPMGRIGTTDEMAGPTAFLLSDWANYITGTTLHVNGGQLML